MIIKNQGIKIRWNTIVLKSHTLKKDELAVLLKYPLIKSADIFVFCSYSDLWTDLATKMTKEEVDLLRAVATDPRKAYITVDGMNEINLPPYSTFKNPTPDWLKFTHIEDDIFVNYDSRLLVQSDPVGGENFFINLMSSGIKSGWDRK